MASSVPLRPKFLESNQIAHRIVWVQHDRFAGACMCACNNVALLGTCMCEASAAKSLYPVHACASAAKSLL